ncbi:SAM-dependent methyltransferase [Azospirillum brasilense]|uniref:SAM-dependent methyltransferase n=1 Tax=Azospirillum brasilense TaxID=192 RepID=A0A0P0EBR9_AZOBR|nr:MULTISPECIES: methyltransferase domain-containing protein [Azospirillum]ALJ36361.1 hypothetical protein AMK58_13590 [Azospirillum brasilense]MDW7556992.1 SAM-dependent methyltransferase [Azospirillum brasilense]MDW7591649.1 SAM-dependent methyltransferase [Azospirillum brasilense]MDW7632340.1 SAM-dependent methyltransferase [Azospirillum brasilense]MDX5952457.1 SAM-dependent methyltransferase [Azospirillum brasilense]
MIVWSAITRWRHLGATHRRWPARSAWISLMMNLSAIARINDSVKAEDRRAGELVAQHESVAAEDVHGAVLNLLPSAPGAVLDVGTGTGRDAAWLARLGHQVVAVKASAGMRA